LKPYRANIERETVDNPSFRKVLATGTQMQLVVMSLKPGEEIGWEVHEGTDQFFRVEVGAAEFYVNDARFSLGEDEVIIVPAGSRHNVVNEGADDLKLYTIYAPPNHPDGTVHATKAEADAAEEHHDQ